MSILSVELMIREANGDLGAHKMWFSRCDRDTYRHLIEHVKVHILDMGLLPCNQPDEQGPPVIAESLEVSNVTIGPSKLDVQSNMLVNTLSKLDLYDVMNILQTLREESARTNNVDVQHALEELGKTIAAARDASR